ncbi:MAG: peptidylprolyl isomerase [Elusimicrobiota bacterium]|nr:peptidylprolyl isomerase [Elusimicrobiota bacterium]MDH5661732.1 peptidylprolyl isomerase [Elusimicrobiota bacterium]
MKRKILFLVLGGLVIGLGLLIFFKTKDDRNVLARIKGSKITLEQFEERIGDIPSYYQGFLATHNGKVELLNGMITEALLIQKAKEEGLHKREDIRRRLRNVEDRVLLETMVQELQKDRIAVSDEEVKEYFEKNEEKFTNPEQVRVSHILVKKKSEAKMILNELREGADFAKLVRKYSIDSITAPRGGDLGYISRGEMIPAFEEVAFGLENNNDISEVIETPFGYHLVKLTGRKKLRKKTQEEIDYEIRTNIQNEKLDRLMEKYRKELMVSINYDLLEKVSVEIPSESKGETKNEEEKPETP